MRTDPKPYIILVEDEAHLARLVATHLENAGMEVQAYDQAAPALRFLKRNFANLLLLDVNLPDMTGFELLTELHRCDIRVPTIFLTGNTLETDKLQGLGLGDDYITKPFNYAELVARIHAVLRRAGRRADLNVTENVAVADAPFEFCGAHIVPARLEVTFPDAPPEKLGRKELGIIAHLHANRSQVLTREALIHAVWG